MSSGIIRHLPTAMIAVALAASAAISPGRIATADPDQDQKFFDLLGQKEIPPVDNANSLIATARKACAKLDGGMPAGDLVELIRNNGFNDNPLARFAPQDRITRTITLFITASVEAYCPYDRGKIASISAYRAARPRIELVSLAEPIPAGEIAPTKPLPVPAQPPPVPPEIEPPPKQQPPLPPRRIQPAPPQQAPQQGPPQQAPPPEAPAPAPEAPAPAPEAPAPGDGTDGGSAPASPTPDQPSPPGHIRLAP